MFFRKGKLYDDDEPLQEQLALDGITAQDEFDFCESNPDLVEKLRQLDEPKRKLREEREKLYSNHDFLNIVHPD